jgi:hypothetical protein
MPFVSLAQEGWAHSHPDQFGKANLKEWDASTKGKHNLPHHVAKHEYSHASYAMAHKERKHGS